MQELNLPFYNITLKEENGKQFIYDDIRKKYLSLTPEEWVRQNFIKYLISEKNVPASLIVIEKGLKLNELSKRADILIYKDSSPILLVECKAPKVKITQDTFDQISRYNLTFKVPYLIVTNGLNHYCCKIDFDKNSYTFLEEIPDFSAI
ncbi:MAG: type I restriction enzyme HsdR N-terminal domain-containing protein [Flavobacteriales bacterium]|nr:type I restriction enzyme HsdR N-terminal domain-containing protein [Flavobacteriales bacterium]